MLSLHPIRDRIRLSLIVGVALAIFGSAVYYAYVSNHADPVRYPSGIPSWAWGATNITLTDSYPSQPDDFTNTMGRADVVVAGVISEVYPSQWAMPDNQGPPGGEITPEHLTSQGATYQIRTPVQFDVKEVFKGADIPDSIKFSFVGGRVEDTAFIQDQNMDVYKENATLIVFLSKGEPDGPSSYVNPERRLWPRNYLVVTGENKVRGQTREVPLAPILEQLR